MISGLNHLTLAVSQLERSLGFYVDLLGFQPHAKWDDGAYLTAGDFWVCLSVDRVSPARDYTHVAFSVETEQFRHCCERLNNAGVTQWKANSSEGDSVYFLDPDGHKLELHDGDLASRLVSVEQAGAGYSGWTRFTSE